MPDMKKKLDRFTAAILAQATQETERTLDDVRRRRDEAYSAAEDQVLREAYQYIHREVARIKSESGRGVSKHMLDNKRKLYLRREQMAQETFALVREKIGPLRKRPPICPACGPCWTRPWPPCPAARRYRSFCARRTCPWRSRCRPPAGERAA